MSLFSGSVCILASLLPIQRLQPADVPETHVNSNQCQATWDLLHGGLTDALSALQVVVGAMVVVAVVEEATRVEVAMEGAGVSPAAGLTASGRRSP